MTLDSLTAADFSAYTGRSFEIHYGQGESLSVALIEVRETPYDKADVPNARQGFSLLFQSSIREYLPQGVYRFTEPDFNAAHGEIELFMVPLAPKAEGIQYEVIFN